MEDQQIDRIGLWMILLIFVTFSMKACTAHAETITCAPGYSWELFPLHAMSKMESECCVGLQEISTPVIVSDCPVVECPVCPEIQPVDRTKLCGPESDRVKYLERWLHSEAILLTQPDYNPSKRQLRRKLIKILKGSWGGYSCL